MATLPNNITKSSINSLNFLLPPPNEQILIVAVINEAIQKIDGLISKAKKATYLLQERRTALISAAVTGKIDVRAYTNGTPL